MSSPINSPIPGAMSVKDFCRWAAIGRTMAYEQIAMGRIPVRKVGRRTIILIADAQHWLESLPTQDEVLDARDAIKAISL